MITYCYATAADIDEFYGERPAESMRAVVIKMDGAPVAIIGMAIEKDRYRAFSEYLPVLEPYLKTMPVKRAIKKAQLMYAKAERPVVAVSEFDNGLLERLGFQRIEGEVYLWRS